MGSRGATSQPPVLCVPPPQVSLPWCPSSLSRMSVGKCVLLFQVLTSKLLHDEELSGMALGYDLLDMTPKDAGRRDQGK